ncbi:MAG: 30S ribosomal protein S18 [Candidatus Ryanbacteria bacterium]|nr:30S ribosomal protein S18 [Candidatus Ryanbacteria bacterium]
MPVKSHSNVQTKQCYFCTANTKQIDYKDSEILRNFLNPQSKILPKRRTGLCATHQRMLSRSVKRARVMGFVPFTTR